MRTNFDNLIHPRYKQGEGWMLQLWAGFIASWLDEKGGLLYLTTNVMFVVKLVST